MRRVDQFEEGCGRGRFDFGRVGGWIPEPQAYAVRNRGRGRSAATGLATLFGGRFASRFRFVSGRGRLGRLAGQVGRGIHLIAEALPLPTGIPLVLSSGETLLFLLSL